MNCDIPQENNAHPKTSPTGCAGVQYFHVKHIKYIYWNNPSENYVSL